MNSLAAKETLPISYGAVDHASVKAQRNLILLLLSHIRMKIASSHLCWLSNVEAWSLWVLIPKDFGRV